MNGNDSKNRFGYGRFFDDQADKDITAMIHRESQPSPRSSSGASAMKSPSRVRRARRGQNAASQPAYDGGVIPRELAGICHREDPTRLVTSACNNAPAAVRSGYASQLDILGINYNIRLYQNYKGCVLIASETLLRPQSPTPTGPPRSPANPTSKPPHPKALSNPPGTLSP